MPSAESDEILVIASDVGSGEFGIRVISEAEFWDGSCDEYLATAPGPQPHFGEIGRTSADLIANCGGSFYGPYARGAVSLQQRGPARIWHLEAEAVSSSEGSASANVNFFDVVSVNSAGPGIDPDALVSLKLRVPFVGDIENAPDVEYEAFVRVFLLDPSTGSLQTFFSTSIFYERTEGTEARTVEVEIPSVPVGTKLFVSTGFLFALSVSYDLFTPPKRASVQADFNVCPGTATPGAMITMASGAVGECEKGDVEVLSVEPVQSVFDATHLVAGKDAVIRLDLIHTFKAPTDVLVKVSIDQPGVLPLQEFEERVTLPLDASGLPCAKTFYLPSSALGAVPDSCETSPAHGSLAGLGLSPKSGGPYRVAVEVLPVSGSDADPSNNFEDVTLPVVDTLLRLGYVKVAPLQQPSYAPMPAGEFEAAVHWSNAHTLAMYPLGVDGFSGSACRTVTGSICEHLGSIFTCSPVAQGSNWSTCGGILLDIDNIFKMANASDRFVTPAVAMVPSGYFSYHGFRQTPAADPGTLQGMAATQDVVLVAADAASGARDGSRIPVTPHEVFHALFRSPEHFDAAPEGYWVGCSEQLGLPFPDCEVPVGATNLLNRRISRTEPPAVWIDDSLYTRLLARTKLDPDPAILLITGTLTRDGTVKLMSLMELPDGATTRQNPDEFAIETIDVQGNVLSRFEGLAIFGDPADTGEGIDFFDPDFAMIAVKIHYPMETARLRFKKGERVILEVDPLSGSLRNAVQSVPDRGFLRNPTQRRKALLQKVDAFEKMLKEGARTGALEKLDNDLRKHAREWLVDFVNERAGVEFTRSDVLAQIDRVEARLRAQVAP